MNRGLIEDVVADFVVANKTFTAYDITTELRDTYPGETWFHKDVRNEVHSIMNDIIDEGDYTKSRNFGLNPDGPWTYSPAKPKLPAQKKIVLKSKNPPKLKPLNIKKDNIVKLDKRQRAFIPKSWLDKLSSCGGYVNLAFGKTQDNLNAISIMRDDLSGKEIYRIDKYGGVKISKSVLENYSFDLSEPIFITHEGSELLLYQV